MASAADFQISQACGEAHSADITAYLLHFMSVRTNRVCTALHLILIFHGCQLCIVKYLAYMLTPTYLGIISTAKFVTVPLPQWQHSTDIWLQKITQKSQEFRRCLPPCSTALIVDQWEGMQNNLSSMWPMNILAQPCTHTTQFRPECSVCTKALQCYSGPVSSCTQRSEQVT